METTLEKTSPAPTASVIRLGGFVASREQAFIGARRVERIIGADLVHVEGESEPLSIGSLYPCEGGEE